MSDSIYITRYANIEPDMVKLLLEERAAAPETRAYVNDDAITREALASEHPPGKYVNFNAKSLLDEGTAVDVVT